jgi:hypothetical protein
MAMSNSEQFDFGPGTNPQYEPAQWTGHVRSYPNYQQPAMTTPWMDSHIYQPSYRSTTMNNPQQFVTGNNAHPLPPRPAPAWPDSQPQSLDHSDSFSDNEYSNTARTLQKGPTPTAFFTTTTATSSSTSYSSTHLPRKLFFTTRESFTKNEQFKTVRNTVEGYDNQERTWSCTLR